MEDHALAAAEIERRERNDRVGLGCAILLVVLALILVALPSFIPTIGLRPGAAPVASQTVVVLPRFTPNIDSPPSVAVAPSQTAVTLPVSAQIADDIARVQELASAFAQYRIEHEGKSPQSLSELFPGYIKTPEIFGLRPEIAQKANRLKDDGSTRNLIDAFSTCRFLDLLDGRAVLLESRPEAKSEQVVYVILDNYHPGAKVEQPSIQMKTQEAFVQLAARQFSESPASSQ